MSRHTILTQVAATKFYVMASGMKALAEDLAQLRVEYEVPGTPGDKLVVATIGEINKILEAAGTVRPGDVVPTEDQLADVQQFDPNVNATTGSPEEDLLA